MLILHIITGVIVLLSGYAALVARKGQPFHRLTGNIFFIAMIFLSLTATYLEYQLEEFPIMGILSLYFVSTSWSAVKRKPGEIGKLEYFAFFIITVVAVTFFKWGWDIVYNGKVLEGTLPLAGYFIFGSFAAMAALLDLNMFVRGGFKGTHRIARHLWRMCFALLLPTLSFLDQDIFPDFIKGTFILWLPIFLILIVMIYWLFRVIFIKSYKTV